MADCIQITEEMLHDPISVHVDPASLDFSRARSIADQAAGEVGDDLMLLSWYDKKAGRFSPDVICCDTEKPSWLVYAESRGGAIAVNINDLEYVFVYRNG